MSGGAAKRGSRSVVLLAEASRAIGYGHAARMGTLGGALAELGWTPLLVVACPPDLASVQAPQGLRLQRVHLGDTGEMLDAIARVGPSLVVHDQPSSSRAWMQALRAKGRVVVHANDGGNWQLGADGYIDVDGSFGRAAADGGADGPVLSGLDYALLGASLRARRPPRPDREVGDRVLVSCGGSDPYRATEGVLARRPPEWVARWRWEVVAGPGWDAERAAALCGRFPDVHLRTAVSDLGPLLLRTNVLVTTGGTTALEAFALGVPTVLYLETPLRVYGERFIDQGVAIGFEEWAQCSDEEAARRLLRCGERAWWAVDGEGAPRVATALTRWVDEAVEGCGKQGGECER
jgi:spore coat polysaccharide biosynthesis predicted glycosyltransferase SpsG